MVQRVADRVLLALPALCLAWLLACDGTEFGNPPVTGTLSFVSSSSQLEVVSVNVDGAGAVVRGAWLALGEISVRGCSDDADYVLLWSGSAVMSLLPGDQSTLQFEFPSAQSYCALRLRADGAEPPLAPAVPPELEGRELLLVGEAADGTPFKVSWGDIERRLRFSSDTGFALDADTNALWIDFDLAAWFSVLDFASAEREADGTILIDETHNVAQFTAFTQAFDASVRLSSDRDGDGALDEETAIVGTADDEP